MIPCHRSDSLQLGLEVEAVEEIGHCVDLVEVGGVDRGVHDHGADRGARGRAEGGRAAEHVEGLRDDALLGLGQDQLIAGPRQRRGQPGGQAATSRTSPTPAPAPANTTGGILVSM
ncbi:hypothetical protein SDC9_104949 [bioreactor metagenome]|uniref:Uncharacterized protein n=1 Tax=bioreactor metagenome TaxID=1076179 RepID=A0A645AY67_9ZZZZ